MSFARSSSDSVAGPLGGAVGLGLMFVVGVTAPGAYADGEPSLAEYAPASAGFFIELHSADEKQTVERAAGAYRLYKLLAGTSKAAAPEGDWRRLLLASLGLQSEAEMRNLVSHRVAIAAPSWDRLAEGVLLVRLRAQDTLIDDVFAPDDIDSIDGSGQVLRYRSRGLLSVATDNRTLVVSHRRHRGSMYDGAVQLLLGRRRGSLAADPQFRRQVRGLPDERDGTCYVAATGENEGKLDLLSLTVRRLAVGLRFEGSRVDFAVRAQRARPVASHREATVALTRMKQLPQTTLAAWCVELNVGESLDSLVAAAQSEGPGSFSRFFQEAFDGERLREQLSGYLGSAAVVAWDQQLAAGPEVPQLAVLIEAHDAARAARSLARAAQSMVDWFDLRDRRSSGSRLRLLRTEYLGSEIHALSLPSAPSAPANSIRPAFAAVGGALVIAVSSDQIRNIIDARLGLTPKLSNLPEVASITREPGGPNVLAVAQPALAAQVVGSWLAARDGLIHSWISGASGSAAGASNGDLGISTEPAASPGAVRVARVESEGAAAGRLEPGDEIVGVDGVLLSLADARRDLRRRLESPARNSERTLRVRRGESLRDVVLAGSGRGSRDDFVGELVNALTQWQLLFRLVDFGSVQVTEAPPDALVAHLTLRFSRVSQ